MPTKRKTPKKTAQPNPGPQRVYETRLANLNLQIEKFAQEEGGKGKLRRFAAHVGVGENHLSQIRTGNRNIGDELAQKLEDALKLERGWFDVEHTEWTAESDEERAALATFRAGLRRLSPANQRKAIRLYLKLVDTLTARPKPAKKSGKKKS